jgi:HSP20 family molecular chaperone IbpA
MKKIIGENKAFHYRCPECHYLLEKELLFGQECPICSRVSPHAMPRKSNSGNMIHVDVVEEEANIRITTELPTVDENNLRLDLISNKLLISSGEFNIIIPLRYAVEKVIERTYRNGVLEVKLCKAGG